MSSQENGRPIDDSHWLAGILRGAGIYKPGEKARTASVFTISGVPAPAGDPRATRYAEVALTKECQVMASITEGGRNAQLNVSAMKVGQLVGAGHLDANRAYIEILDAARSAGLGDHEIERTFRSGFNYGLTQPREVRLDPEIGDAYSIEPDAGGASDDPAKVKDIHTGQLRIAERFVRDYAWNLLYVHGIGWHYWDATHWVEDKNGKARRRIIALLKRLRHESVNMPEKERDRLLSDVKRCESSGGLAGVLDIARHLRPMTVSVEEIDAHPHLFNALNGTLNLDNGQIQPHDPRDLITKCADAEIDLDARSLVWQQFLGTVLPDEDVRNYLQRVLGVAMLGKVQEHILPILTGTGGNGKSVLVDAALAAFGSYGITVDPQLIMKTKHERHATFMADLQGARLVVTSETNEGEVLAAATVKRLTGGDKIRANRMRENPFEFEPSHTLAYVTNHKPQVSADDSAMWRRLSVIPFDVTVADPDTELPAKIRGHLSAVLSWCYRGWLDYQSNGLKPPEAVQARTNAYRSESDPMAQFISEECVTAPMARVKAKALFEAWAIWAMHNGHPAITQTEFGRRMSARGFEKKKSHGTFLYAQIGLRTDEEEETL